MELSGRLATFPLCDVLEWARQERRTGALVVVRRDRERRIYLDSGRVVGCTSNQPKEHYGEHLILRGHLTEAQLLEALAYCAAKGKRLGSALIELGMMSPELVTKTLRNQIFDASCGMFLWKNGVFYFTSERPLEEEILPDPIDSVHLILEGTRWIDELARIRGLFVHDNIVLEASGKRPDGPLLPLESRTLRLIDGHRNLTDLYNETHGSYFRFLEAVFRLTVEGFADIKNVGEASLSKSSDFSVYDLLVEQAAHEERHLLSRRGLSIPIEVIQTLYPVWVVPPSYDELSGLAPDLMEFATAIDGGTTLGALMSEDEDQSSRQLEFLVVELRQARLALLPAPVAELDKILSNRREGSAKRWWAGLTTS